MVLSDDHRVLRAEAADAEAGGFSFRGGRGQKHRLDDDAMSVQSTGSKRKDLASSAEKNKSKFVKNKPKTKAK